MNRNEIGRFLVAGGSAAAINWLSRLALAPFLPLAASILAAHALGMVAGFWLYRRFVFRSTAERPGGQVGRFILVNGASGILVLGVTLVVVRALEAILPLVTGAPAQGLSEALAHGFAIGVGAVANYVGHRLITFRSAPSAEGAIC